MEKTIHIFKENYQQLPNRFIRKLEADIQYILNTDLQELKCVYLFGSCARGEVRSSSDIDLLILTEDKIKDRERAADIRWTLSEPLEGVKTDIVYMNEKTQNENTVFKNQVNKDKKLILEVRK